MILILLLLLIFIAGLVLIYHYRIAHQKSRVSKVRDLERSDSSLGSMDDEELIKWAERNIATVDE